jgi:hypothetical protein
MVSVLTTPHPHERPPHPMTAQPTQRPTTPQAAPTCAGCAHHEPDCAYCSLLGERRKASDAACDQWTDGKVDRAQAQTTPQTPLPCPFCGRPPTWAEHSGWRVGMYECANPECYMVARRLGRRPSLAQWNSRAKAKEER